MPEIEEWWAAGEIVPLPVAGAERAIFVRRMGAGPTLTLLHGFPSSSHDYASIASPLAERNALLMPDFLGFGASAKPTEHRYSLTEQADLVEALWQREGVSATRIVGHDYAVSVVQELLARQAEGTLAVELEGVLLLNGGVYPDIHRPQPSQLALLDPEQGPQLSAMINEELFVAGLAATFSDRFDASGPSAQMWRGMAREDGQRILHLLIRYISDREEHARRWTDALERTPVPVWFVWGMLDPVSGAHMAERIRVRIPRAPFTALEDVSHWPQVEAPERVLAQLTPA